MIIGGFSEIQFKNAIAEARKMIAAKGGEVPSEEPEEPEQPEEDGDEDNNENLQSEIQKAISEIEAELNQEPKIFLEKDEEWRSYIKNSSTLAMLEERKQKILTDIAAIRQQPGNQNHNLPELITQAINLIKQSLAKNPPVDPNELTNPD